MRFTQEKNAVLHRKLLMCTNGGPSNYLSTTRETVVSGMHMSRDMEGIIYGGDAKEVVFPRSVRGVGENAFEYTKLLRQVVVNEGLERLGMCTNSAPKS